MIYSTVAHLGEALSLYCTALVADVNTLSSYIMAAWFVGFMVYFTFVYGLLHPLVRHWVLGFEKWL